MQIEFNFLINIIQFKIFLYKSLCSILQNTSKVHMATLNEILH